MRQKLEDKLKFDFIKFHKLFHNAPGSDPQYAQVFPEDKKIIYSFLFRPRDNINRVMYLGDIGDKVNSSFGFATALKTIFQNTNLNFLVAGNENDYPDEISVTYKTKTEKEFKKIVEYLRTIKTDSGMPKKDSVYFCYD